MTILKSETPYYLDDWTEMAPKVLWWCILINFYSGFQVPFHKKAGKSKD